LLQLPLPVMGPWLSQKRKKGTEVLGRKPANLV
jgi:hypothetical protein